MKLEAASLRRARQLAPVAVLLGLVLLFFWKLALTEGILARGDVFLYFYPYWTYRAQAFAAGRLPLWDPLLFMGAPFLANPQAGVLYPPNWPLAALSAPTAVKVAVLLHIAVAATGAYAFARHALKQSRAAASLSAALFALGGYLTSQVEHVNQLQGLAWLPWLLVAVQGLAASLTTRPPGWRRPAAIHTATFGAVLALQLLAGHTQSAFLSVAAAFIYAAIYGLTATTTARPGMSAATVRLLLGIFAWLFGGLVVAAGLSAGQLLPTLELSGQSLRAGGLSLRETLSFSLDPRLVGRAFLPGYSRATFSEFSAYLGIAGLMLAALGALGARRHAGRLALTALTGVGLLFALGAFNPVYVGLAALPPFNLFRVPARWLVLAAFGGAMLAGFGLDDVMTERSVRRRWLALGLPVALMALTPLAAGLVPAGETGPLGLPPSADLAGWLLALVAVALVHWLAPGPWRAPILAAITIVELFAAAQVLSFNHLTTPEAWTSVRPAMTQLLAAGSAPVAGRFLSMSGLRFDPGDAAESRTALVPPLPEDAFYDFVVATKHKEVLSPNLPLAWGISAVDGYDGGVLPLRHYADFAQLLSGAVSADGRLRENIATAPDPRLLALVNTRYLITDKVKDAWVEGVFYDLEFGLTLGVNERAAVAYVPRFQATALGVVAGAHGGSVEIALADGSEVALPITGSTVPLPEPSTPLSLTLVGPLTIRGLSLVDTRSGAFQSLTLGPYRLVHSGDVKVYEHQAPLARAFVVPSAEVVSDAEALARLAEPGFDPAATALLAEPLPSAVAGDAVGGAATITNYAPESIKIRTTGPGYLVLTDAYYPGWAATVDGQPTPIVRADVMFRAVALPSGEHMVEFRYSPRRVWVGLGISGAAWLALLVGLVGLRPRRAITSPRSSAGS